MTKFNTTAGKPPAMVVSDEGSGRLTKLAIAASDRFPDVAEELQIEMERAQVLSTATIPEGVVQNGIDAWSIILTSSNAGASRSSTRARLISRRAGFRS